MGALSCVAEVARCWSIRQATAGMTLLAWGGQIPDMITAVELARDGMADAAISQAVASQVLNVTLGLGLPFLLFSLLTGAPATMHNYRTVVTIGSAVLAGLTAYLLAVAPDVVALAVAHARGARARACTGNGGSGGSRVPASVVDIAAAGALRGGEGGGASGGGGGDGALDRASCGVKAAEPGLAQISRLRASFLGVVFTLLYVGMVFACNSDWYVGSEEWNVH